MCVGPVTSPQTINNGHTHTLTLTAEQINVVSGDTTYNVSFVSSHMHTVTLTAAERAMLRAGMFVNKTSSNVNDHTHGYRIECTGS
jgi:hypothetical protein